MYKLLYKLYTGANIIITHTFFYTWYDDVISSKEATIREGLRSIVTNDWRLQDWLGQREKLSFLDAKLANYVYHCTGECTKYFTIND